MEDIVLEEKEDKAMYNLKAFFFSFAYYTYMKQWVFAIIGFVLTVILPFQLYFAISFIESWVLWRRNSKGKSYGEKWLKHGIVASCIAVFLCVILKYWFYRVMNYI